MSKKISFHQHDNCTTTYNIDNQNSVQHSRVNFNLYEPNQQERNTTGASNHNDTQYGQHSYCHAEDSVMRGQRAQQSCYSPSDNQHASMHHDLGRPAIAMIMVCDALLVSPVPSELIIRTMIVPVTITKLIVASFAIATMRIVMFLGR